MLILFFVERSIPAAPAMATVQRTYGLDSGETATRV
jgi:hypothetical protein